MRHSLVLVFPLALGVPACTCALDKEATPCTRWAGGCPDGGGDSDADTDMDTDTDSDTDSDTDTDSGPCEIDADCPGQVCDAGDCVDCRDEGDATDPGCEAAAPHCDEDTRTCLVCGSDDDCADPAAARCGKGGASCDPCDAPDQCAHLSLDLCDDGTCVECTVGNESPCGANSCDPATNTCTLTPRASVETCEGCVADSECVADHRCIPMEFAGVARPGGYCLEDAGGGCANPYRVPVNRTSLSGAPATDYCGINEDLTTCEAVLDLAADAGCAVDDDCGAEGLNDGRCETVNLAANRCTYSCSIALECPVVAPCDPDYCGG